MKLKGMPNAVLRMIVGSGLQDTPAPNCPSNVPLEIATNSVVSNSNLALNAAGEAEFSLNVANYAAGRGYFLQAYDAANCKRSNIVTIALP